MVAETEIAWAAGFFDGEGYTRFKAGMQMSVIQATDDPNVCPEVLQRFVRAVGCGELKHLKRYNEPDHHRDRWAWECYGDSPKALDLLWPYLGTVKRVQANVALAQLEARENRADKRREYCKRGHLRVSHSKVRDCDGKSVCNACCNERNKEYRERVKSLGRSDQVL